MAWAESIVERCEILESNYERQVGRKWLYCGRPITPLGGSRGKAIAHGLELRAISRGDGLPAAIGGVGLYMAPAFFVRAMAQTRRQSIAAFVTTKLLSFRDLARA